MKRNNSMGAHIGLSGIVRIIRFTSVLSFVALCGATIVPIYHETNNAEAATGTATAPTLTFTSTNATASVSLAINDVNGTFATSTEAQKAAFSIATNNCSGYTLNLTASGDTTTLNDDNSHTISSIDYDVSAADFTNDTSLNNKWGFIPSHYSSVANTDNYYFPASTSSHSDTLMVTSAANSNNGIDNADNYTIGIGLRADYNTPSGTYTNSTFLIQYVVNPVDFSITYSDDNIAGVSNLPLMQGGSAQGGETIERVTLSLAIPTRTGYTFAGWCLGVLSNNGTTCTGTTFAAGAEFGIDKTTDNSNIILKALWTVGMGHTMQEFAAGTAFTTCSAMSTGDTITLLDARDGQAYTVGKLADGKCWMTENLNLAGGTVLSADNTDVTIEYITGFTTGDNLAKDDENNTIMLPASSSSDFSNRNGYDIGAAVYNSGNKTNCGTGQSTPCYSYYSWVAATLGGRQSDGITTEAEGHNAAASICPKGWRLPTSTTSNADASGNGDWNGNWKTGDWYTLAKAYGVNLENNYYDSSLATGRNFYNNAGPGTIPNFLPAGVYVSGYVGGSFARVGEEGYYWSATAGSSTRAYDMHVASWVIYTANYGNSGDGHSVRCVMDPVAKYDTTVSMDTNTTSVVFDSNEYGTQVATANGDVISLREGVSYTITASFASGYKLSSWSNTANSTVGNISSNPTTYTVTGNSTLTVISSQRNGMTFDEAYELAGKTKYNGYYTMQDSTSAICANINTGQTSTLIDIRDDAIYRVAKLADDRCWMLDNLALDLMDTDVKTAMLDSTNTKTNASYQTLTYLFNGNGSSPYAGIAVANATSTNYYNRPTIAKSGTCNNAYCVNDPTSGKWSYDSVTQTTINGVTSYVQGKIGIYYNFCAASAGSYCYASSAAVDGPDTAIDAAEDICPSGWRMPTGGAISTSGNNNGGGEFQNLYNKYGNNAKSFQEALSTPLSGRFSSGKAYIQGNYGDFWSSTLHNDNNMYHLRIDSTNIYSRDYYSARSSGLSVRCIMNS